MTVHAPAAGTPASAPRPDLTPLFRPESVALIGFSSRPGSAGQVVLRNLQGGGYTGTIHLVGRSGGTFEGQTVLTDVAELPEGVGLAIFLLPSAAILETVRACVARGVRAAVCFASGFAEMGDEGREQQQEIAEVAQAGGMALLGPNTVGYFNYVDGFYVMLVALTLPPRLDPAAGPAVAVVAQSGGIGAHIAASLQARGVPLSYMMTVGNEAQIGLAEMIHTLADDTHTGVIVVYAEQIRGASAFLDAARRARAQGKVVVLLHPGRSERSQEAARSHTGALAGNHAAMQLMAAHAGVAVVDTLEEAIDVGQLLLRYPEAPTAGVGLVTASGALCGITQDYVEPLGLELPVLGEAQTAHLRERLPVFLPARNPIDVGTSVDSQPDLIATGVATLLSDPGIGSVLVSMALPGPAAQRVWLGEVLKGMQGSTKPLIYVMQNEDVPIDAEALALARQHGLMLLRSPERALRTLACVTRIGRAQRAQAGATPASTELAALDLGLGQGTQAEWVGKRALQALGIPTPAGALARSADEAVAVAERIGYPVVLKAQAATLAHKSEVGGVLLNLADAEAVRAAWVRLHDNVAKGAPGLVLDGALVEAMGARGLELVVGASRDPQWGPIVMVGLGGIWVEALGDVQLLPPDLPPAAIVERLLALKGARLLTGFRGAPPVDLEAVAAVVAQVGQLMLQRPEITEIDVNPLVAYGVGQGVVALDALIVTAADDAAPAA